MFIAHAPNVNSFSVISLESVLYPQPPSLICVNERVIATEPAQCHVRDVANSRWSWPDSLSRATSPRLRKGDFIIVASSKVVEKNQGKIKAKCAPFFNPCRHSLATSQRNVTERRDPRENGRWRLTNGVQ